MWLAWIYKVIKIILKFFKKVQNDVSTLKEEPKNNPNNSLQPAKVDGDNHQTTINVNGDIYYYLPPNYDKENKQIIGEDLPRIAKAEKDLEEMKKRLEEIENRRIRETNQT